MPRTIRAQPRLQPALRRLLADVRSAVDGDVWLVGGFMRDLLIQRPAIDIDLAVSSPPAGAARALAARLGGHAFPLDDGRGQYRVQLGANSAAPYVDVGPLRGDIATDLAERDFTIDALAAPLTPDDGIGAIVDPFGGESDLAAKQVRLVGNGAITADPLRLLRGVRLATELGFEIEADTAAAMTRQASLLNQAAAERQRDELIRIFSSADAVRGLRLMDTLGLLDVVFPEMAPARGVDQPERHHYWDVFDHSLETVAVLDTLLSDGARDEPAAGMRRAYDEVLGWAELPAYFDSTAEGAPRLALTKLAGFLHDVAKPETKAPDTTGRIRFFGHAEIGARTAAKICDRLRFGAKASRFVSLLIDEHLRPTMLAAPGTPPSDRALYRFFRELGEAAPAVLVLHLADAAAAQGPRLTDAHWRRHLEYIGFVLSRQQVRQDASRPGHFISGHVLLKQLALEPGPTLGRLLAAIDEAAAAGEVRDKHAAVEYARELLAAEAGAR